MQLSLPFFPKGTKMISGSVGVYEHEDIVQYIVNGLPIFAHGNEDLQAFRISRATWLLRGFAARLIFSTVLA